MGRWPFKKKDNLELTEAVSTEYELSDNFLDIRADYDNDFWCQKNYHDLLLSPDRSCMDYDIADFIVKAKLKQRYKDKKTRKLAKLILHNRCGEWKLYRIKIFNEYKIVLHFFNYQDENRMKVTLDISILMRAILYVQGFESDEIFAIDYLSEEGGHTFTVFEKISEYSKRKYSFKDGEIKYVYINSGPVKDR